MAADTSRRTLWALLFGNLVIGTGVLLPAGLMSVIMAGIDVSAAEAGLLLMELPNWSHQLANLWVSHWR
jgi:predicted MFS family arabinose efflux permease